MTEITTSDEELTPPSKTKDPARPKRKKARRACLACQRAHLTCGDERPCQRCIKRGLQDACRDGMRKKAKYLHDAPNEALMPGAGDTYHQHKDMKLERDHFSPSATQSPSLIVGNDGPRSNEQVGFDLFNRTPVEGSMPPPLPEQTNFQAYTAQHSPLSSRLQPSPAFQHDASRPANISTNAVRPYDATYYDPNNPSFLPFDLASMNFGNHYGALEFGILGQLSSGANDGTMQANQHRHSSSSYDTPNISSLGYLDDMSETNNYGLNIGNSLTDWQTNPSGHGLQMNSWNVGMGQPDLARRHHSHSEPHAYSIGASGNISTMSPESSGHGGLTPHDRGYPDSGVLPNTQQPVFDRDPYHQFAHTQQPPAYVENGPSETIARGLDSLPPGTATMKKRRRNPSSIYSSVTKSYPYTQGFHALIAVLQRRLPRDKLIAISQALGSIRPSFIACMRALMDEDLVFMEMCFQRQLLEYEDHINECGTPTIVCRRTSEVAYAGKEFSLLTGWSKDVLLGKAPNLNVNYNTPTSGSTTGTSSRTGFNTPRVPSDDVKLEGTDVTQPARPQAVFLADFMDEDSIVQFYEDFAELAFADSKGNAWSTCTLLRYKTKDDLQNSQHAGDMSRLRSRQRNTVHEYVGKAKTHPSSTSGPEELSSVTKVDCMYCWTVRRDVFDIPSLIVINFLPLTGS